jgi:hypothetical protein
MLGVGSVGVGGTRAEKGREKQRGEGKGFSPLACLSTSNPKRERILGGKSKEKKKEGKLLRRRWC